MSQGIGQLGQPEAAGVDSYLLDQDERPPASFEVESLMGIEGGMTVEQVDALMPSDAVERTEVGVRKNEAVRSWAWDGLRVSVTFETNHRTVSEPVISREDAAPHVLLPRGLILGRSTLSDFVAVFGAPTATDESYATGRLEVDVGWEVETDVRELFSASLVHPPELDVDPLSGGLCDTTPYLYTEPSFTFPFRDDEDGPIEGAACLASSSTS